MKIIRYDDKYRDDMLFMILQAKDALGKIPSLNEDLLDVNGNYLQKGDMFWLAIDENQRVIASLGFNSLPYGEARLHRFFVKADMKRRGIGTALLTYAENYLKSIGKKSASAHLGEYKYFYESYSFYAKRGYEEYKPRFMIKYFYK